MSQEIHPAQAQSFNGKQSHSANSKLKKYIFFFSLNGNILGQNQQIMSEM